VGVADLEDALGVVDRRGRELAERLARLARAIELGERVGADQHRVDQRVLVVDQLEGAVDRLARAGGVFLGIEPDVRDADPGRGVLRHQRGQLVEQRERALGVAVGGRDRRLETDHVGVLAVDAAGHLELARRALEIPFVAQLQAAIDEREQPIGA
jgi:hypothetical protein